MAASRTRRKLEHPLFGHPSELPAYQLPTLGDVLRLVWKYKCEDEALEKKFSSKSDALSQAVTAVSELWETAIGNRKIVPLISLKAAIGRLKRVYDKGIELVKKNSKNDSPKYREETAKFRGRSCLISALAPVPVQPASW